MAPGGAHPRCALGWKRLGAPSASAPRREPEQRCWVDVPPWDNLDLAIGLSGTFRSRLRRPTCPRRKAEVPKDFGQPARTGIRSARYCFPPCTRAGSSTLGASRRRPVHYPAGSCSRRSRGPGAAAFARGHGLRGVGWSLRASQGGARGQPVVPLRPSLRASRARSGGVFRRAPAWQSPSRSKAGGGSPSRPVCRRPVIVRPARALAGRAGSVRRLPEEAAGSGSCYRQGRTGVETRVRTPRQENSVPFECSSGTDGHKGPGHRPLRAGARSPDKSGVRRPICGKARCGGRASVPGGSPKRTWLTGVSPAHRSGPSVHRSGPRNPPKRDPGGPPKRTGLARRSGPVGHLPGGPSWFGHSAVRRT